MRYPKLKTKNCAGCGSSFQPRNSLSKYCSGKCCYDNKPKKGEIVQCYNCKKNIYRAKSHIVGEKNFCSRNCRKGVDFWGKAVIKCKECGKDFKTFKSAISLRNRKHCSKECQRKANKGKKNKSWKGGTALKKALWTVFSKYIRTRDRGVCISCGKQDDISNMDAGHYVPKTAGLSLYFDEMNVNCQCVACNRYRHGNLSQYALALKRIYGDNILELLDEKRRQTRTYSPMEYQELIERYTKLLKDNDIFK